MTLLEDMQLLVADVYGSLNVDVTNFGGRETVKLVRYQKSGSSGHPLKNSAGWAPADAADFPPVQLVPLSLQIGQATRWKDGLNQVVGDAKTELARYTADGLTEITLEMLQGKDVLANQKAYYLIGEELFSVENDNILDVDGLTWMLWLKRVPQ